MIHCLSQYCATLRPMRFVRLFCMLLFCTVLTLFVKAQMPGGNGGGPGKVMGTVKDFQSKKPVEYATVSILKNNVPVNGTVTDKLGEFLLENIAPGMYTLKISFIGYGSLTKDSVLISPGNFEINLGNLFLQASEKALETIQIEGEKDLLTLDIDKKVYDVSKNITNTGGSAADVLGNVPSVNVDIDGNVSLRGSEGVVILIDGKPSGLSGSSRKAILDGIPASSIESVEIITNPSAKYDADGMSGIINIKLKKDKKQGLNGSLSLSAGTRDKYNGAFTLNYRDKKFNFFTNYSYRYNNSYNNGNTLNTFFNTDSTFYIDQQTQGWRKGGNHLARAGFDFYPNQKNTFSIAGSFGYNYNTNITDNIYNYENNLRLPVSITERRAGETRSGINYDLSGNWKHTFTKKGRELTADISYSGSSENENGEYKNVFKDTAQLQTGQNPIRQNTGRLSNFGITTAQLDFTETLRKNMGLETGIKATIRHNDNDFGSESFDYTFNSFRNDPNITNRFVYHEQVYAAYASFAHSITSKWGYKAGLRLEQTFINTDQVTTQEKNKKQYLGFFPSAHVSYKPKTGWELRLGYSRRINRPRTNDLNPFTDYTDPVNLQTGNPDLNPEYINSGEFNVSYSKQKHYVSSSIYYRYIENVMTRFRSVDANTGVSTTTQFNVGYAQSAGFEIISRNELFKWWNITSSINLYYYRISSNNSFGDLNNNSISGFGRITSNWKFLKGTEAQLTMGYWAPQAAPQGVAKAIWGIDVGIKRDFWKNRLTVNLAVTDIFNTRRFAIESRGEGFELDLYRKRETRIATLTLSLKLGKQDAGQRRNRRDGGGGGDMDEGF